MPEATIMSLELDSDALEELNQLLSEQHFAIKHEIEKVTSDIKLAKLEQILLPAEYDAYTRKIVLAEAQLAILEGQRDRRDAFEIIASNARPAVLDLVVNGEQTCRHNPQITKNQLARAEVAHHFSSIFLERLNKPSTASSPDVLHEMVRALSSDGSLTDVMTELSRVEVASAAIIEHSSLSELPESVLPLGSRQGGIAERYIDQVVLQMFFIELRRWLIAVAGGSNESAILLAFLEDCQVGDIPRKIDWARALPFSHQVPSLYPVSKILASK